MKEICGKILYGSLFVIVLPICLLFWQSRLDKVLSGLPALHSPGIGFSLIMVGGVLLVLGWLAIMKHGQGLPMNAYPPKKLVSQSIYAIIRHPIYTGFTIMIAGYSIFIGSAAGLWVVAPAMALCSLALVMGYERIDMKIRFGTSSWKTTLRIPSPENQAPVISERLSAYIIVFLPWLVMYEAFIYLGPMPDSVDTYLAFEQSIPVIEWTEMIYASTYLFVIMAPLLAKRRIDLRNYILMGIGATAMGCLGFLLLPFKATPRPFIPSNMFGQFLLIERGLDGAACACPAFHVVWSLISAWMYTQIWQRAALWYFMAVIIALSCITTGMHSLLDISAGVVVFLVALNQDWLWHKLLRLTERLANSWRAWRIGRVRIINHGFYVGAGAFLGMVAVAHLAGPEQIGFVLITSFTALFGAGIWGQALEGSSKLSRPFGFYGGLLGICLGLCVSIAFGAAGWQLAGAFAVAGPFVQAMGRLRCLVQGCCHGRECSDNHGIVVFQERSRVVYHAELGNRPIYPTQLYSILYNIGLGALLVRLWTLSAPMPLIGGGYLLLGGIGRFIEESYRGEPQTPRPGGLAIYQWLAAACVLAGAIVMTFPGKPCPLQIAPVPLFVFFAAIFGAVVTFAMGVDFPESNRRFSHLA